MASIGGQSRYLRAFRHLALTLMAFSLIVPGTACIIVPFPAGPAQETDIIDDATLQSLVGLSEKDVNSRLGTPDFVGPRGRTYLMVYEGEKHYPTRMAVYVYPYAGGISDPVMSKDFVCYVIELDDNRVVQDYETRQQDAAGIPKPDSAEYITEPIDDCSEAVWEPGQREGVLTKIAYLQRQAEGGDRASAFTLASEFSEPMYLKEWAQNGDREAAFKLASDFQDSTALRVLAEQGDREAAFKLASDFQDATGLRVLAKQGDKNAAYALASEFQDPSALRAFAEQGDRVAAAELLILTGKSFQPLQEMAENGDLADAIALAQYAKNPEPLKSLAENGNLSAAYALYQHLRLRGDTTVTAWHWLCSAANADYAIAQAEIGSWFRSATGEIWEDWSEFSLDLLRYAGIDQDNVIAYMWYTLAITNGDKSALTVRDYHVAKTLSDNEIAQANQMAREWKPGDCPSADSRLPTSRGFIEAMNRKWKLWGQPKGYAKPEGNALVEATAALKYQLQKGEISDEEYMRKQREIVNEYTRKSL